MGIRYKALGVLVVVDSKGTRLEPPAIVIHYRDDRAIPIWGGERLARGIPPHDGDHSA